MKRKGMSKSLLVVILSLLLVSVVALTATGCEEAQATGTLVLNLSDGPKDGDNVDGVWITIIGIEYHLNGEWKTVEGFGDPQKYNLTDLTNGDFALLGEFELPAGDYTQIRFLLDIREEGSNQGNSGCYIEFADHSTAPLFCPSGNQTGYKAVGNFTVPAGGEVEVTADWDMNEAVVEAGQKYILKPTIRLIVTDLPPAAPTGLAATAVPGSAEVTLNWTDNTETDLAGYNVYRSTVSGQYETPLATVTENKYTFEPGDGTYYYVVTAFDDAGNESGYSAEVSATPSS